MKRLARAAALTLAIITFCSAAYGNTSLKINTFPYVIGAVSFPPSQARASRNQVVRHSFELQIPEESRALSELSIGVPNGLSVGNKISVSAQADRKIDANISINGKGIVIVFPKPVAPGTRLRVNMEDVQILGINNAWIYLVSARLIGLDADIPVVGVVRIGID